MAFVGLWLGASQQAPAATEPAAIGTRAEAGPGKATALPLEMYGDLPGIEQMALSPNGRQLAVLARIQGVRRVLVIDAATKAVKVNAPVGEAKLRELAWAGEDIVLITTTATVALGPEFGADKYELAGVLIVPLNGGKIQQVFERSRAIGHTVRGQFGVRQVNGRWVGYYGGLEMVLSAASVTLKSGRPALYAVDLATNSARLVAPSAGDDHYRDWLVNDAGQVVATLDIATTGGRWTIVNAANKPIASGVDPTGDVSLLFLGKGGSTAIYATEDDTSGTTRWWEVPLAGGAVQEILGDVAIEQTYVDADSGRLMGYLERGTVPKPHFFDPARQAAATKVLRAFPKVSADIVDWSGDFGTILVHASGGQDSGTWYVVDVAARRANDVGFDRVAIGPELVGPISTVTYKAGDGLEMDGVLTLPPAGVLAGRAATNLPAVMLPHGGPTAADSARFDWWAQAFASRGFAVFQPNFRGSTNRDDSFRRAGNGQWGRKMQSDISDGLAELARRGIVDPKRACIVGASYGGYAALAGVTLQRGLYRCAVAVAPVADLDMMYAADLRESGNSGMTARRLRESLGPAGTYAAVSPRKHAREADAPILLIHGKDDTVVPFRQSLAMADALRDAGKPVELVVLRQEDHWLSRAATRKQMLEAAVAFVEKHNPAR